MATSRLLTVEQYRHTVYRPDRDYVDGEVLERNLGTWDHSAVQSALVRWFSQRRREWDVVVQPELRVQVSATRFRIPDVCVIASSAPRDPIVTQPPLICIEILSPEDTRKRTDERLEDYRRFGVRSLWVIDPATQRGFDCSGGAWNELGRLAAPDSPIYLDLPTLFADTD